MLLETRPLVNLSAMSTETVIHYHAKLRNMVFFKNYLGVLTINNMKVIVEAVFDFLLSPSVMFKSVLELMKTRNIEKFVFSLFSNYQRWQAKNRNVGI